MHSYCTYIRLIAVPIDGLVTDVGNAGKNTFLFVWNSEVAAFVADSATEQSGVGRIEDCYVSVCYRFALFINDSTRQVAVCLMRTLYKNFMLSAFDNSDRIETNNLQNGISQFLMPDICRDLKILQFVIDEVDCVVLLQVVANTTFLPPLLLNCPVSMLQYIIKS